MNLLEENYNDIKQIKEVIKRNYSINNCEGTEQLPKNIYRQRKGEQK